MFLETIVPSFLSMESHTLKAVNVWVSEIKDYKVVVIQFSGLLSDSNVERQTEILNSWISKNGYTAISEPINAAYNGPFTVPWFRRNEVLIEIM